VFAQELHHLKFGAIMRADVTEMTDVRMIQRRNGSRLALEALHELGTIRKMIRQDLDGDGTTKTHVFCALDLTHAACTERRLDFIRSKFCARDQGHPGAIIFRSDST
jgi:hypothetical protein